MNLITTMMALDSPTVLCGGIALLTAAVVYAGNSWRHLAAIPTVGGTDIPLLSFVNSYRFVSTGRALLQEGYERFKGKAFKVAMIDRWVVILSGNALLDELRKLPEDVMSFTQAANQAFESKYTIGPEIAEDSWHRELVRTHLTKRLDALFPDVHDEVVAAFDEYLDGLDTDWIAHPALDIIRNVVCRASNRIFLGLPKCRDFEWIDLNVTFTMDIIKGRILLNFFPPFLKPIAGRLLITTKAKIKRACQHLEPIIAARRQQLNEHGANYADKPDDMLSWLLESPRGLTSSPRDMTLRILALNFAAVHTSSNACIHALYTLAAHPEYLAPLREEIERVTRAQGWSKASMTEMVKLDSFLKECMRLNSISALSLTRLAMQTYTFGDGTTVPKGTMVAAPMMAVHSEEENYEHADEFRPWRFTEGSNDLNTKRQFTSTSIDYLSFGHGKAACPGRFFASNEIKVMLSHLIINYDIRTELPGVPPPNRMIGSQQIPHQTARLLFRKRAKLD